MAHFKYLEILGYPEKAAPAVSLHKRATVVNEQLPEGMFKKLEAPNFFFFFHFFFLYSWLPSQ